MKPILVPIPKRADFNIERRYVLTYCESIAMLKSQINFISGMEAEEGYRIYINEEGITVSSSTKKGAFYALMTLKQLIRQYGNELPFCEIEDEPYFKIRGYMLDISRNKIPTLNRLKEIVDMLSELKINHIELYVEGAPFAFKNHKAAYEGIDVLTGEEIVEFDKYCAERFIELVPTQNTFGHMGFWLTDIKGYNHLAECPNGFTKKNGDFVPWALCLDPTSEEAFDFVKDLSNDLLSYFSSDKYNVCCDETLEVGLGKSKPLADEIGIGRVYLNYLLKLHKYCTEKGKTMMFWADIINEYPELVPEIPKDIIALNWGYYDDLPKEDSCIAFEKSGVQYCVCPGSAVWNTIVGNTTQMLENIHDTIMKGYRHNAIGAITTDWGDNGHIQGIAPAYPAIVYGAAMSWQPEINEHIDLPSVLNLHIFEDAAGVMGDFALDIGRYADFESKKVENASVTFRILQSALDNGKIVENLTEADIKKVEDYLINKRELIYKADMQIKDKELIVREYELGIDILLYALLKARYIIKTQNEKEDDNEILKDICFKAEKIIDELKETWLVKNKTSHLQKTLNVFNNDINFLKKKIDV